MQFWGVGWGELKLNLVVGFHLYTEVLGQETFEQISLYILEEQSILCPRSKWSIFFSIPSFHSGALLPGRLAAPLEPSWLSSLGIVESHITRWGLKRNETKITALPYLVSCLSAILLRQKALI